MTTRLQHEGISAAAPVTAAEPATAPEPGTAAEPAGAVEPDPVPQVAATDPGKPARPRVRMSGTERREQLLTVGRALFAERGYDATSIEEIAHRANVSKPVVYEHFGGKEGLYAVVVHRAVQSLLDHVTGALSAGHPRELLEQAAIALLDYIETESDNFAILVRDSPVGGATGTFASLINDIASQVEYILASEFHSRGLNPELAGVYSQALVGMVALTGQWWLDVRKPKRDEVAAHLVNLAWNGLSGLEAKPTLRLRQR